MPDFLHEKYFFSGGPTIAIETLESMKDLSMYASTPIADLEFCSIL